MTSPPPDVPPHLPGIELTRGYLGHHALGAYQMVERGRLDIDRPLDLWLEEVESHPLISVLHITARIAAESVWLGESFHNDSADQIIVATARCFGFRLITSDERIRS